MINNDDLFEHNIEEGMALMAGITKKLILDMVALECDNQDIINNILVYLEDYINISPEFVNQFFKDNPNPEDMIKKIQE